MKQKIHEWWHSVRNEAWTRWRLRIFLGLFFTYFFIYLCRANITVSSTLLLEDEASSVDSKSAFGTIITAGTFVYACGKLSSGFLVSSLGLKRVYAVGIFGASAMSGLFGLGVSRVYAVGIFGASAMSGLFGFGVSYGYLVALWSLNRLFQSCVWVCTMQALSNWYPRAQHGTLVALLSMSFLSGDAFAKAVLGGIISAGASWQSIFFISGAVFAVVSLVSVFVLKFTPEEKGFITLRFAFVVFDAVFTVVFLTKAYLLKLAPESAEGSARARTSSKHAVRVRYTRVLLSSVYFLRFTPEEAGLPNLREVDPDLNPPSATTTDSAHDVTCDADADSPLATSHSGFMALPGRGMRTSKHGHIRLMDDELEAEEGQDLDEVTANDSHSLDKSDEIEVGDTAGSVELDRLGTSETRRYSASDTASSCTRLSESSDRDGANGESPTIARTPSNDLSFVNVDLNSKVSDKELSSSSPRASADDTLDIKLLSSRPASPTSSHSRSDDTRVWDDRDSGSSFQTFVSLMKSPDFLTICALELGLTFVREVFRDWLPLLYTAASGVDSGTAAVWSAVYPAAGCVSTIFIGYVSDRLPGRRRGVLCSITMVVATVAIVLMWLELRSADGDASFPYLVFLATLLGVGVYGVYVHLQTLAVDICASGLIKGSAAVAIASGLSEGLGYGSATLSGVMIGRLVDTVGWGEATLVLVGITLVSTVLMVVYTVLEHRRIVRNRVASDGGAHVRINDAETSVLAT